MDFREYLSQIGKRGGAAKSEKKTAAAQANARRPRPNARKTKDLGDTKKS